MAIIMRIIRKIIPLLISNLVIFSFFFWTPNLSNQLEKPLNISKYDRDMKKWDLY